MSPQPGTKVELVPPTAVKAAIEADNAETGAVTEVQSETGEGKKGEHGSVKVQPFKPPTTQEEKEKKTAWIEIELVDEADQPIPGARYRVTLPDGSVDEGTLDGKGFARVDGFEPGTCKVTFPALDQAAWKKV